MSIEPTRINSIKASATRSHVGYKNGSKRSVEGRYEEIREIVPQTTWVSEGGFLWWIDDLRHNADVIIWLDLHWSICFSRIVSRHIRADFAGNNAHPGFLNMLHFAKGARRYYLDPVPAIPAAVDDDATKKIALQSLKSFTPTQIKLSIAVVLGMYLYSYRVFAVRIERRPLELCVQEARKGWEKKSAVIP